MTAPDLTPVQLRAGRWYKREDLYTGPGGVNGAKLRACRHLILSAVDRGAREVISAASVLSPQNAMAAVTAAQAGVPCTVIVGATTDVSAARHPSIAIALTHGARLYHVPVGYNPYLQRRAAALADERPGAYWLRYGITTPDGAGPVELAAFHAVGADQVANLPNQIRTLVVPFGSGNSAAGVLYGLDTVRRPTGLQRVMLVAIGPDRRDWLQRRLDLLGVVPGVEVVHIDLHGTGYARYGDRMPETVDGITLHPTYEGKVVRYLNQQQPAWWTDRDDSTCLWIVGGPLPKARP